MTVPAILPRCFLRREWGYHNLEPDQGGPLDIEHPTEIATRPLSPDDQDDRIRMIFELTSNDPLPQVEEETLRTYYGHLLEHLVFPFAIGVRLPVPDRT